MASGSGAGEIQAPGHPLDDTGETAATATSTLIGRTRLGGSAETAIATAIAAVDVLGR